MLPAGRVAVPEWDKSAEIKPSRSKHNQINPSKMAWFYLVLFVQIGTFQWVTANPNKKSLPPRAFREPSQAPFLSPSSTARRHGADSANRNIHNTGSRFPQAIAAIVAIVRQQLYDSPVLASADSVQCVGIGRAFDVGLNEPGKRERKVPPSGPGRVVIATRGGGVRAAPNQYLQNGRSSCRRASLKSRCGPTRRSVQFVRISSG